MSRLHARYFVKRVWMARDIAVSVLGLAVLLLLSAAGALAQSSLGPLADYLVKGPHGPWVGSIEDGSYLVRNRTDSSAIRYYHIDTPGMQNGRRKVAVDVAVPEGDAYSHAGLLYGLDPGTQHYYFLAVEPGWTATLFRRGPKGLERLQSASIAVAAKSNPGFFRLEIAEAGQEAEFLVNGRSIATLANEAVGRGRVGIAVWGKGAFGFRNFAVGVRDRRATAVAAAENRVLNNELGNLAAVVTLGRQGPWRLSEDGATGAFVMENKTDRQAVKHYSLATQVDAEGRRSVEAEIEILEAGGGSAGLVYGLAENNGAVSYFMALRSVDGAVALYYKHRGGMARVADVGSAGRGPLRMKLIEHGRTLDILFDGQKVKSLESDRFGRGRVGIVALGRGKFGFSGFRAAPTDSPALVKKKASPPPVRNLSTAKAVKPPPVPPPAIPPSAVGGGTAKPVHFTRYEVVDRQGWGRPIPVLTFLGPKGWNLQGGVQWSVRPTLCLGEMVSIAARLTSPDGAFSFEIFPLVHVQNTDNPNMVPFMEKLRAQGTGCQIVPPFSAIGYLSTHFVQSNRPGAQVVGQAQRPRAAGAALEKIRNRQKKLEQMVGRPFDDRFSTDAASVALRYVSNGTGFEETVSGVVSAKQSPFIPSSVQHTITNPLYKGHLSDYFVEDVYAVRAPQGRMAEFEPIAAMMMASVRANPVWQTAFRMHVMRVSKIAFQGFTDRHRMWMRAQQEISEIRRSSWKFAQDTRDRTNLQFTRAIREIEPYQNTETGETVDLTHGYESAWGNGQGDYILSPDPTYSPNADPLFNAQNWAAMRKMPQ